MQVEQQDEQARANDPNTNERTTNQLPTTERTLDAGQANDKQGGHKEADGVSERHTGSTDAEMQGQAGHQPEPRPTSPSNTAADAALDAALHAIKQTRPLRLTYFYEDILHAESGQESRMPLKEHLTIVRHSPLEKDVHNVIYHQSFHAIGLLATLTGACPAVPKSISMDELSDPSVKDRWDVWQGLYAKRFDFLERSHYEAWSRTIEKRMWDMVREAIAVHRSGYLAGMRVEEGLTCSARLELVKQVLLDFVCARSEFVDVNLQTTSIPFLVSAPRTFAQERRERFLEWVQHQGDKVPATLHDEENTGQIAELDGRESQREDPTAQRSAQRSPQPMQTDTTELPAGDATDQQPEGPETPAVQSGATELHGEEAAVLESDQDPPQKMEIDVNQSQINAAARDPSEQMIQPTESEDNEPHADDVTESQNETQSEDEDELQHEDEEDDESQQEEGEQGQPEEDDRMDIDSGNVPVDDADDDESSEHSSRPSGAEGDVSQGLDIEDSVDAGAEEEWEDEAVPDEASEQPKKLTKGQKKKQKEREKKLKKKQAEKEGKELAKAMAPPAPKMKTRTGKRREKRQRRASERAGDA